MFFLDNVAKNLFMWYHYLYSNHVPNYKICSSWIMWPRQLTVKRSYVQAIAWSKYNRGPHAPEATDDPTPLLSLHVPWKATGLMVVAALKGHSDLTQRPLPCTSHGRSPHGKEKGFPESLSHKNAGVGAFCKRSVGTHLMAWHWKCCRYIHI